MKRSSKCVSAGLMATFCAALLAVALPPHADAELSYPIELFPTEDDPPLVIAPGPANSNVLWATLDDEPVLLKITLGKSGAAPAIKDVDLPKGFGDPRQLILGPDKNLWITSNAGIARMTPNGDFTLSSHDHKDAFGITEGPDGRMWFSYGFADAKTGALGRSLGRLTTDLSSFERIDVSRHGLQLVFLTKGSDGNIWGITPCFFEGQCSIARITPTGDVKLFKQSPESRPYAMTSGPDGALWYADYGKHVIGRLDPASGEVKELALEPNSQPTVVTMGPDGALWFTENGPCKIGRMTADGKSDTIAVPAKKCELFGITTGPDGNMWFTVMKPNAIGRIKLK